MGGGRGGRISWGVMREESLGTADVASRKSLLKYRDPLRRNLCIPDRNSFELRAICKALQSPITNCSPFQIDSLYGWWHFEFDHPGVSDSASLQPQFLQMENRRKMRQVVIRYRIVQHPNLAKLWQSNQIGE